METARTSAARGFAIDPSPDGRKQQRATQHSYDAPDHMQISISATGFRRPGRSVGARLRPAQSVSQSPTGPSSNGARTAGFGQEARGVYSWRAGTGDRKGSWTGVSGDGLSLSTRKVGSDGGMFVAREGAGRAVRRAVMDGEARG